ncbi:hypothetical protein RJT34_13669 [Clitoria ternatea]|uniref:Uncharacterized protein n=1 Tax=Clitoria ternatea TaxID=43366 RepID=A0AAN9JRJ5_CLITE
MTMLFIAGRESEKQHLSLLYKSNFMNFLERILVQWVWTHGKGGKASWVNFLSGMYKKHSRVTRNYCGAALNFLLHSQSPPPGFLKS